jgi:hypothetical protein
VRASSLLSDSPTRHGETVFTDDVDVDKRKSYEDRARRS